MVNVHTVTLWTKVKNQPITEFNSDNTVQKKSKRQWQKRTIDEHTYYLFIGLKTANTSLKT